MEFPRTEAHPGAISYIIIMCVFVFPARVYLCQCVGTPRLASWQQSEWLAGWEIMTWRCTIPTSTSSPFSHASLRWVWQIRRSFGCQRCLRSHLSIVVLTTFRIHLYGCRAPGFTLLHICGSETHLHFSKLFLIMCFVVFFTSLSCVKCCRSTAFHSNATFLSFLSSSNMSFFHFLFVTIKLYFKEERQNKDQ